MNQLKRLGFVVGTTATAVTAGVVALAVLPAGTAAAAEPRPQSATTISYTPSIAPGNIMSLQPPAPPAPAAPPISVGAGAKPSRWKGGALRDPSGATFPARITRWANITVAVMDEQRIPRKYLAGILAQIQQESDGSPNNVNTYDVNAAAGTPSAGLLQVIGPTYQEFAKRGLTSLKYQMDPYANIFAALKYVRSAYGLDKFAAWNSGSNEAY